MFVDIEIMFNFMKKEKTEEERAEKERKKSEKREKKKSSKREKLSNDELQRLEEVRKSLKIKGVDKRRKEQDFSDETDRASVVGLRYSHFYLGSESGVASPDSSDSASTWSSASLNRPRSILKSKHTGGGGSVSESSSKLDLDDEHLLLKNTQQNEIISYSKSPGYIQATHDTELEYSYYQPPQLDISYFESQPGECLGFKSKKLLNSFPLELPEIIKINASSEPWRKQSISRTQSSSSLLQVIYSFTIHEETFFFSISCLCLQLK